LAAFAGCLLCASSAWGALVHDPYLSWRTITSPHFLLHYHNGETAQAKQAIAIAEHVHTKLTAWIAWTPAEPVEIVLTDRTDFSNGGATPYPSNRIVLNLTAPDDLNGLEDHGGWMETVITHEYAHILHLDMATGPVANLRNILGRNLFTFPNQFQPSWMIEGFATFAETDIERGLGRGQSSYFGMLMRAEVEAGVKPLRQVNQPIRTWPRGVVPYLYGVHFFEFVAEHYGRDKVVQLLHEYSDNLVPFRINANSETVLGDELDGIWKTYESYLRDKYRRQSQRVREDGVVVGERLTQDGWGASNLRVLEDGTVYFIRTSEQEEPALMRIKPGQTQADVVARVHPETRFDVHPNAGVILAQVEFSRNTNPFYDLYHLDPESGNTTRLSIGGRYRYVTWNPEGSRLAAVQYGVGTETLVTLDSRGQPLETLWQGAPGDVLGQIDWSPDGKSIVAARWVAQQGWNLMELDIATRQWRTLADSVAIEGQPQYSPDGTSVVYVSELRGIYNISLVERADGEVRMLTNVTGGAFSPSLLGWTDLYYLGYTPQGFDLFRLKMGESDKLERPHQRPGPSAFVAEPLPELTNVEVDDYSPWRGLAPQWWSPHVILSDSRQEWGAFTSGSDALQRHAYFLDAAYDSHYEHGVGSFSYIYDRWLSTFTLRGFRYGLVSRDADGNVERLRLSDSVQGEVMLPWLRYKNRWSARAAMVQENESDHFHVAAVGNQVDTFDGVLAGGLTHDTRGFYTRSISPSNGHYAIAVAEHSGYLPSDYQGKLLKLDVRQYFALGNEHVLAFRGVGGFGMGAPRPFHVGGIESAALDFSELGVPEFEPIFNKRYYGLRGYPDGLPHLRGRRMGIGTAEWRFPLQRVESGWMAPPIAVSQISGTVFADGATVWDAGKRPKNLHLGAGAELNFEMNVFYQVRLDVRAGVAYGWDEGGEKQVYFSMGRGF